VGPNGLTSGTDDVAPKLIALLTRPAVRALVDRDLELVALLGMTL